MIGARRAMIAGLFLLGVSCQLVLGLDRPRADPPVAPEAAAPVDPCAHASPPPPPDAAGESTDSQHFWLAGKKVIVPLIPDGGVKEGLDLDNSCTCARDLYDGGPSCEIHGSTPVCDYDGGIDDSVTALSGRFPVGDLFDPGDAVNRLVVEGSTTLLIYVERYNGQPNDSDVGFGIVTAAGLFSDLGCDDQPRGRTSRGKADPNQPSDQWPPAWDGCDRWTPNEGSTLDNYPNVKPVATLNGYVSGGTVFAAVDSFGLEIFGSAARASFGRALARVIPLDNGLYSVQGVLTGRVPFPDLVDLVGRSEIGAGNPLCTNPVWSTLGPLLCSARDVMADSSKDHRGEGCDAVSVAIGFEAFPARVASGSYTRPGKVSVCDASVTCP